MVEGLIKVIIAVHNDIGDNVHVIPKRITISSPLMAHNEIGDGVYGSVDVGYKGWFYAIVSTTIHEDDDDDDDDDDDNDEDEDDDDDDDDDDSYVSPKKIPIRSEQNEQPTHTHDTTIPYGH
ncbi:hypothetical protein ElyMa_000089400 [Elysia marginata]|uniref:Macroglobulin domain-containing protein n=1 Tax=Elysia marginata TaxID=1093978 RepID=A0AAV4EJB4_9GAST|nr:hypothetical protein ElyMa_000089400 [Elysia marginata]